MRRHLHTTACKGNEKRASTARALFAPVLSVVLLYGAMARASGLDIPTLYGARYAGVGGAAVAQVDDASAIFHNPAGLGCLQAVNVTANLSLLFANLQTSPDFVNQNVSTGVQVGPAPLAAAGFRLHPMVVAGVGIYPVGAAGGRFEYVSERGGEQRDWVNEQSALAFELSPGVAVNLPADLRVGLGYRMTMLKFERLLGDVDDPRDVNIDLTGFDFTGLRLGVQWQPLEWLTLGVAYRHQISITGTADSGKLLGFDLQDIESALVVPAKLSFGARLGLGELGLLAEIDYIRNSQFEKIAVSGELPQQGDSIDVDFLFNWTDSFTLKSGAEYLLAERWKVRAGYAFDGSAVNPRYPTSFGSPPADQHYLTAGGGYDHGPWRVDLAFAYRIPTMVDLRTSEIADETECRFCAKAGRYRSSLAAVFVDFSMDFGLPDDPAPADSR